jgi:hypothetical protein
MGLRGRRDATSVPTPPNSAAINASATKTSTFGDQNSSPAPRINTNSSANRDQARRAASRRLIAPPRFRPV